MNFSLKFICDQEIFTADSNLRSADAELQQRASEYLALSKIPSLDVLATVLEEMPPFPEKESSGLLNLLKRKRPGRVPDNPGLEGGGGGGGSEKKENGTSGLSLASHQDQEGGSVDLLGLGNGPSSVAGVANGGSNNVTDNISKFYIKNNGVVYENDIIQVIMLLININN